MTTVSFDYVEALVANASSIAAPAYTMTNICINHWNHRNSGVKHIELSSTLSILYGKLKTKMI